jgi:hypothetical protein
MLRKKVKSHILEKVIATLMVLFGLSAIYIFINTRFGTNVVDPGSVAIIQILLIVVLAILAQTLILIKIYEQHN